MKNEWGSFVPNAKVLQLLGLLIWVTVFGFGVPAYGQNCLDYSRSAVWVGDVELNDNHYHAQFVDGDRMYNLGGGTEIFDISDIRNPVSIGEFEQSGRNGCQIGDHVFVCDWHNSFRVWNVADPEHIVEVTVIDADLNDVAAHGSLVVGCGTNGNMIIIDVSDPALPAIIADFPVDLGTLKEVIVHDGIIWIAGYSRLAAVDISNPELPEIISVSHYNGHKTLAARENVLMVYQQWDWRSQALFLDISDLANPAIISRLPFNYPEFPKGAVMEGKSITFTNDRIYIGSRIIDVSDIFNPTITNYLNAGSNVGSYMQDGYLALTSYREMNIFDVRQDVRLEVDGRVPGWSYSNTLSPAGNIVCSTNGIYEAVFHDIEDLGRPRKIGRIVTEGYCWDVAMNDELAVLASNDHGFVVMQYGLEGIHQIGEIDSGFSKCDAIVIENEFVFLAHEHGLSAFDISTPEDPQFVSTFYPEGADWFYGYNDLEVRDKIVFATANNRFDIVDFNALDVPVLVGTSSLGDYHFCLDGDYAFLGRGRMLHILDISDYLNPVELSSLGFQEFAWNMAVVDDIAYIVGQNSFDLQVVDVSDHANPVSIGWLNPGGIHSDISFSNGRLFLSDGRDGLAYVRPHCSGDQGMKFDGFSVTGGRGDAEVSWISPAGFSAESFVLFGKSETNEWEVSIEDDGPQLTARDQSWNLAHGGEITYTLYLRDSEDQNLYLTARTTTVETPEYKILLSTPYPNPFNPMVTIDFALDVSREIKAAIYDIRGHQVKVLALGLFAPGLHSLIWNGTSPNGDAAAGIYFVHISSGDHHATKKITLVR